MEDKATYTHLKEILERQAWVLASIARITSSFPAAFPPFRTDQIHNEKIKDCVEIAIKALGYTIPIREHHVKDAEYLDGGILNNKPFGPALRAIFHRMPRGKVERRLFYVEPDPEVFGPSKTKKKKRCTISMLNLLTFF